MWGGTERAPSSWARAVPGHRAPPGPPSLSDTAPAWLPLGGLPPAYLSDILLPGAVADPETRLLRPVRPAMSPVSADDGLPASSRRGAVGSSLLTSSLLPAPAPVTQEAPSRY